MSGQGDACVGLCLGFDTSNYTTSAAVFGCGMAGNRGKLLTVPEGALGLRQSDALFQHVKRLHLMVEQLRTDGFLGRISAVGASTRPREVVPICPVSWWARGRDVRWRQRWACRFIPAPINRAISRLRLGLPAGRI